MNDIKRGDAQKGPFFADITPARQFVYDPKGMNMENPSFLDGEGGVNNQSVLRQSFINGIGNELGNISAIDGRLKLPEVSVDIDHRALGGNILDESLANEVLRMNQKPTNPPPQKGAGQYKKAEKVGNTKAGKYEKFEDSEDQIEEQQQPVHPVFKQYQDVDIDLEYNFNELLNNIENLNPELLVPSQMASPAQLTGHPQGGNQQQQPVIVQQSPEPVPDIPEEELLRIHNSYIDIYSYLTLFYLVLFGISNDILPPITMGVILWLFDIVVFKKRVTELFRTPAAERAKRRKYAAFAVECLILAGSKFYILYALKLDPTLRLTYVTVPSLVYSVFLCFIVAMSATGLDIAWLAFRFVFWFQFLMVLLKLDDLIDWDWRAVFWIYYFTFFLVAFYCAGLLLILTCLIYFLAVGQIKGYQFCGLFWLFLFLGGNAAITFGVITGFVEVQNNDNDGSDTLINCSILGGIFQQLAMIVFSSCFKRHLLNFFLQILRADSGDEFRKTRKEIHYEKEQEKNNYPGFLIMFSPTYFMTYEQKMKLKKHQPTLLSRLKYKKIEKSLAKRPEMTAINILKELESTNGTAKNLMATQSIGDRFGLLGDKSSTLVTSRKTPKIRFDPDQKDLNDNERFTQGEGMPSNQALPQSSTLKVIKMKKNIQNNSCIDSRVIAQAQKQIRREKLIEKMKDKIANGQDPATNESPNKINVSNMSQVYTGDQKSVLSEGDAEYVDGQNMSQLFAGSPPKKTQQNEADPKAKLEPCNVCFEKAPDAVIMKCGHGGLCYECALEIWKKSPDCYMCRKPIEKILQIDSNSKKWGITKVLGSTKMVMKDVEVTQDVSELEGGDPLTSTPTRPQYRQYFNF